MSGPRATYDRGDGRPTQDAVPAAAEGLLHVEEVADAVFLAGELFARKFGAAIPDFPLHYVCFYRPGPSDIRVAGYVHYSAFEASYLCGGLVIDDRVYRRMALAHRTAIRSCGGIARHLMSATCRRLAHAAAIWAYVGDVRSERVVRSIGFERTTHPYVMVCWTRELSEADKRALASRVASLGPF